MYPCPPCSLRKLTGACGTYIANSFRVRLRTRALAAGQLFENVQIAITVSGKHALERICNEIRFSLECGSARSQARLIMIHRVMAIGKCACTEQDHWRRQSRCFSHRMTNGLDLSLYDICSQHQTFMCNIQRKKVEAQNRAFITVDLGESVRRCGRKQFRLQEQHVHSHESDVCSSCIGTTEHNHTNISRDQISQLLKYH